MTLQGGKQGQGSGQVHASPSTSLPLGSSVGIFSVNAILCITAFPQGLRDVLLAESGEKEELSKNDTLAHQP